MFISIIIPTYNRSSLLKRALDSVLRQTNENWECIVVDDFSEEDISCVVDEYYRINSRFRYLKNFRGKGAQGARNSGIMSAHGDWALLLDSDNEIVSDYIDIISAYICNHTDIDIVTNAICMINENGNFRNVLWKTEGCILNDLLVGKTYVDNSSACIRKSKIKEIGYLDERCPSYQEWDTHIRLSQVAMYGYVPNVLTLYNDHKGERISSSVKTIWANGLYVLYKHRKLWRRENLLVPYSHFLLELYDKSIGNSAWYRLRLLLILAYLYPRLLRQLFKRKVNRLVS